MIQPWFLWHFLYIYFGLLWIIMKEIQYDHELRAAHRAQYIQSFDVFRVKTMICLKLNWFLSRIMKLCIFVWTLRSSVLVVFNNFLLIIVTDRSKISSDQIQKRLFFAVSLCPLSFFANTPFENVLFSSIFSFDYTFNCHYVDIIILVE